MSARQPSQPPPAPPIERFTQALRQAMAKHRWSERRLASELGITIGTTQKYFRYQVNPFKVGTGINRQLARLLGITLDSLVQFYETGEYTSDLSFEDVVSWVSSNAGLEHLGPMLDAMSSAGQRIGLDASCPAKTSKPEPYTWPRRELQDAGISDALRQRMGLTDEALDRLEKDGVFDDALVEAFAVATNYEEEAVRDAFASRTPVE
jgi:transcriptional regulator with XRE-family HTH domain